MLDDAICPRHQVSRIDGGDPEMLLEWPKRFHYLALERSRLRSARFTTTF